MFVIAVSIGILAALAATFASFVIGARVGYRWHEDEMQGGSAK